MQDKIFRKEQFTRKICSELNNFMDLKSTLVYLTKELKSFTGCQIVAIRCEDNGDYPYYVNDGFPEEFIMVENSLCAKDLKGNRLFEEGNNKCLLECMCGNVIRGKFDAKLDFFTIQGSFWSNNTTKLIANTTEKDRQEKNRNYCYLCGYESLALIPIKSKGENIGLIQLNDKRENMFSLDTIEYIEMLAENVGMAIFNNNLYTKLIKAEKSKIEAIASDQQKSLFLANMNHEIRTPLNGIIGTLQLLTDTNLTKEQLELIDIMQNSSNLLLCLVNSILDISKIKSESFNLKLDRFNLYTILNEVIEICTTSAKNKGLNLENSIDITIPKIMIGDAIRLKQILFNLIDNAIKFTDAGYIKLSIKKIKDLQNLITLLFVIEDTGIGISNESKNKIFNVFTQLDNSTKKKFQGTGLGLTIARKLIEMMGGNISVKSEVGKGSKFIFEINFQKLSNLSYEKSFNDNQIAKPIKNVIEKKSLNILIIEDNEISQILISKFFYKNKIKHKIADNSQKAFELLNIEIFDMIILDIQLPDIDGYNIAKEIRSTDSKLKDIPIIAITAYAQKDTREKCINYGINEYMSKPLNLILLTNMINKLI